MKPPLVISWLALLVFVLVGSVVSLPGGATINALWVGALSVLCGSALLGLLVKLLSHTRPVDDVDIAYPSSHAAALSASAVAGAYFVADSAHLPDIGTGANIDC